MVLYSPDMNQIVSHVIGQEYGLHKMQIYKVLDSVPHEGFIS